jgi:hypothetical protein
MMLFRQASLGQTSSLLPPPLTFLVWIRFIRFPWPLICGVGLTMNPTSV